MLLDALYFGMVVTFFTHELDAVKRHEWRVLPLTSFLPDHIGEQVFIWTHIPLFFAILWYSESVGLRIGLSVFAIAHVGLHWLYRRHRAYEFNNRSSWSLILLTGLFGGAYLVGAYM